RIHGSMPAMGNRPPDAPLRPPADPRDSGALSSEPVPVGPRIAPPISNPLELGSLFAGRYQIERFLGAGGMGAVYDAPASLLGRRVAIKIPAARALGDPSYHRRFMREAQAAARLSHPNICTVYDTGMAEATPYIAMAYVEGRPLVADGACL